MAAIHAHHRIAAHQRRCGGAGFYRNIADRGGNKAVQAATALKQEIFIPCFRQPQLETGAVRFAVGTGARADFAFYHAMWLNLLFFGRAAGKRRHFIGIDTAGAPLHLLDFSIGNFGVFQGQTLLLGMADSWVFRRMLAGAGR